MAGYVAAAGALIGMYGQYQTGQQNAENYRQQAMWSEIGAGYTDYISNMQASNATWQAEFQAGLTGARAGMARREAGLTFEQGNQMARVAAGKRVLSERGIVFEEDKAFDALASGISTKKTQMGKSGVRVNQGSSESFLANYWDKKASDINTQSSILRAGADLEESSALFNAYMTKSKGTIQLDEASLMDSQANYLLSQGDYSAGLIRTQGKYQSMLQRAQAAIYRRSADQSITAGWLGAAGTGTSAGYSLLS